MSHSKKIIRARRQYNNNAFIFVCVCKIIVVGDGFTCACVCARARAREPMYTTRTVGARRPPSRTDTASQRWRWRTVYYYISGGFPARRVDRRRHGAGAVENRAADGDDDDDAASRIGPVYYRTAGVCYTSRIYDVNEGVVGGERKNKNLPSPPTHPPKRSAYLYRDTGARDTDGGIKSNNTHAVTR